MIVIKNIRNAVEWKDLRSVSGNRKVQRSFNDNIIWKLGDGNKILFWEAKWLGDQSLKPSI